MERVPILIIGAGIVGAGVAYGLRSHADRTFLLEAESRAGTGISSRNSGVIHAGLYYPPDSLKTRLCRRGAAMLYDFAERHAVPVARTGKYIVANGAEECHYLDQLANQAGVTLREGSVPEGVCADRALFSPASGIVDIHALVEALLFHSGVTVLYHQRVHRLQAVSNGIQVEVGDGERYLADHVINCAGLAAPAFAPGYQHHFARGAYFKLNPPADLDLPHLVYPAVPKKSAALGIHLTRNIHGEAYLGPDLEWIDREDYRVDPERMERFYTAARRYLPWLSRDHLQPGYAGIRPKLSPTSFSDFTIIGAHQNRLIHCLGIESPGLTASMAIGEHISRMLGLNEPESG